MKLLPKGSTRLDCQSRELVGYLDALFARLMLPRQTSEFPAPDCSREEIRTLIVLGSSGQRTMSYLAAALGVPLSTATHTIDRLVRKGLAVRTRSETDRRLVVVEMSQRGKELQAAFRSKRQAMARNWLDPLSPAERETFAVNGKDYLGRAP